MFTKSPGIVLRLVRHSDKASVVTVYTRDHGRISLMAYGLSGRKSNNKTALFMPLSLIEISAVIHPGKEFGQLKEATISAPLINLSNDPVKNALTFFISELLIKTLNHPEADEKLFDFLTASILYLDAMHTGTANFHILLMIKLSAYLGFEPNPEETNFRHFDLLNGVFTNELPSHEHCMDTASSEMLHKLLQLDYMNSDKVMMGRKQRRALLDYLLEYYRLHVTDFYGLKSTEILHEIFS